jgi:hypothetical protein
MPAAAVVVVRASPFKSIRKILEMNKAMARYMYQAICVITHPYNCDDTILK